MSAKILPFTISNQNKIEATSTLRPQARWVKTVQIKSIQKIAKSIQKNTPKITTIHFFRMNADFTYNFWTNFENNSQGKAFKNEPPM